MRRHDGVYRTFAVRAVPVTGERGEIVEWVGVHTDITEQREAEQHVRESLRRLELALDAASVGMWDWDLDTGAMTWTRQTHLITGIAPGTFTGGAEQFFALLLPQGADHAAAFLRDFARRTRSSNPNSSSSGRMARAAGSRIAPPPSPTTPGGCAAFVGTLRDVTRRKELESEREGLLTRRTRGAQRAGGGRAGQG